MKWMLVVILLLPALQARGQSHEVPNMQPMRRTFVQAELLEYAPGSQGDPIRYDLQAWTGYDVNRLWLKADGDQSTRESAGETELQALYGRLISPFWDALVGVRFDAHYGEDEVDTRAHLALGIQGVAPYWFELEPTLFISHKGHVSAGLEASYELLFTQRLILEPRIETSIAVQEVPAFGVGRGFNEVELGLRARYEIVREFAPYLGIAWGRRIGGTADLARAAGEPDSEFSIVAGVRMWR